MFFNVDEITDSDNASFVGARRPGFKGIDCHAPLLPSGRNWLINFLGQLLPLLDGSEQLSNALGRLDHLDHTNIRSVHCHRLVFNDNRWSYLPPDLAWLSLNGRFACIELGDVLDIGNYYLLWDVFNEELLQLSFHDLEGMNDELGVLYCRTHNDLCPWKHNYPLQLALHSINASEKWKPVENEPANAVYFNESEQAHKLVLRIFGTALDMDHDLSNRQLGQFLFRRS